MVITATKNQRGYMHIEINAATVAFLEFCSQTKVVADIGAAYGVATIPALEAGANVIACDISTEHIQVIEKETPKQFLENLKTIIGKFPYIEFENKSIDGVLLSHVLPFLNGEEMEIAAKVLFDCLKSGGKIFIYGYTPFVGFLDNFLPVYEERKKNNVLFPSYIENFHEYSEITEYNSKLPQTLHPIDLDVLQNIFSANGFTTEKAEYLDGTDLNIHPELISKGKECAVFIARKK